MPSHLNILQWRHLLRDYHDSQICDFLEFGWPVNYTSQSAPSGVAFNYNHRSASQCATHVDALIATDVRISALIGPFHKQPFATPLVCSPLQIVTKDNSNSKRLVVDLSFPLTSSVNSGISNETFLDQPINLHYPSVNTLAQYVRIKGRGCLMFKTDLKSAYKQIPIQPNDWHLCAISWKSSYYVYVREIFGLRSSAYACQRTISSIPYLMRKNSYLVCSYLDDIAGAESVSKAFSALLTLQNLLGSLNLIENPDKVTLPATKMIFLGILLNSEDFTMTIPEEKLQEIRVLLNEWLSYDSCTLKQLQSLIGKLQHVSCCIRGGRIFINRLLNTLREANKLQRTRKIAVSTDLKRELNYWFYLMTNFNGVSIMSELEWTEVNAVFASDASMTGAGGVNYENKTYFKLTFPARYLEYKIHILEMLSLLLCCKVWGKHWKGRKIQARSDNQCVVIAVNKGASKDPFMQSCIRELFYICSIHAFEIRAVYISSKDNVLPDSLSRFKDSAQQTRFFSNSLPG